VDVDALQLMAALLRVDPGAPSFLDLASGEILRVVAECDPEEEPRRLDDPTRFVPIRAFTAEQAAAFWSRAAPACPEGGVGGLYQALASAGGGLPALLLAVRSAAEVWLAEQGLSARARLAT
jgi:hypothetical protein